MQTEPASRLGAALPTVHLATVHLLLVRALRAHHAAREVAHPAVRAQGARGTLRPDQHLAGALRLHVLLLQLLLQVHLLLQLRVHLHAELALRRRPAVALARVLALRLGSLVHRLLLVRHLLLQDIRIAVHVLDVDDVLVLFVLAVVVVISVSLVATQHIATRVRAVIRPLFGLVPLLPRNCDALCAALTAVRREPLRLLELLDALLRDALGAACGRRSLLAAGIAIGVRFKLRDGELRWQVEALIVSLVLLSEELLPVVVQVLRKR